VDWFYYEGHAIVDDSGLATRLINVSIAITAVPGFSDVLKFCAGRWALI